MDDADGINVEFVAKDDKFCVWFNGVLECAILLLINGTDGVCLTWCDNCKPECA